MVLAPCKGIRIPESGKFLWIWNPGNWVVESEILGFGIPNTTQGIRNPTNVAIRNSGSTDKESTIQYLGFGTHGVESRIPDCLGFPLNI